MGCDHTGKRRAAQQKTVKPPEKLAKSTPARDKQDIDRFLPYLGGYKLVDLRPEHFRKLCAELRKQTSQNIGMPLSEYTVEGVHAYLCGILSDAMESGFLNHDPAWPSRCKRARPSKMPPPHPHEQALEENNFSIGKNKDSVTSEQKR